MAPPPGESEKPELPARKPRKSRTPVARIGPLFKIALILNALICFSCLATMIGLTFAVPAESRDVPKHYERLFAICSHTFSLTAGAFLGLVGARAAAGDAK